MEVDGDYSRLNGQDREVEGGYSRQEDEDREVDGDYSRQEGQDREADGDHIIIIIYCWLIKVIAQSTAQGHLRAFHKFKFRTQVE